MRTGSRFSEHERYLRVLPRLVLGGLVALWAADVLVNLELPATLFLQREFAGRPVDFFGLLVGEVQIAVPAALVAWLGGAVLGFGRRSEERPREAVAILSALVVALVILARTPDWPFAVSSNTRRLVVASAVGLITWPLVRAVVSRRPAVGRDSGSVVEWVLVPALVVGFGNQALNRLVRGNPGAAVAAAGLVLVMTLVALAWRPGGRRVGLRAAWVLVAAAILLAAHTCLGFRALGRPHPAAVAGGAPSARPHIVLIVLDTVRADHLGGWGYERDTMPALEEWASGGLTAMRAVSPAGWTAPAHASFFSGRTVSGHGIHHGFAPGGGPAPFATLPVDGVRWLPELLSDRGYYRLAVSANPLALPPGVEGFNRVIVPERGLWHSSTVAARVDEVSPVTRAVSERLGWRMPYAEARSIVDLATRAAPVADRPLFLFVNLLDAHGPFNPPGEALKELGLRPGHMFSRYQHHRKTTLLWESLPDGREQFVNDLYDGELRWLDMNLAALLRWVDERLGEGAVVVVTSDHGEELGEEGRVGHEHGLPQRIIHVPLFVRAPGVEPQVVEEVVDLRRLFDFILAHADGEASGVRELVAPDGVDVLAERYPSSENTRVLGRGYDRPCVALIRDGMKAVGPPTDRLELYNLEAMGFDREVPVSDSLLRRALEARVRGYWEEQRDRRAEEESASRLDDAALRSLGYLH